VSDEQSDLDFEHCAACGGMFEHPVETSDVREDGVLVGLHHSDPFACLKVLAARCRMLEVNLG
jgi:hypothetical protein